MKSEVRSPKSEVRSPGRRVQDGNRFEHLLQISGKSSKRLERFSPEEPRAEAAVRTNPAESGGAVLRTSDFGLRTSRGAFTLIEMLVVIAIIGILAAVSVPTMNAFKPNVTAAATQQLLADIGRARQLALSERTTVYMVFVPANFWNDTAYASLSDTEKAKAERLLDKQHIGYNFVTLRSLGDQPGAPTVRYLSSWKTLPEGAFIPPFKFKVRNAADNDLTFVPTHWPATDRFSVKGFQRTWSIPWPSEGAYYDRIKNNQRMDDNYVELPYLAFSYTGELLSDRDEFIPLARGSVSFGRDSQRKATKSPVTFAETPPSNSVNSAFNLVSIDKLTGRTHVRRQEVQ